MIYFNIKLTISLGSGKSVSIGNYSPANTIKISSHSKPYGDASDAIKEIQNFFCYSDLKKLSKYLTNHFDASNQSNDLPDVSLSHLKSMVRKIDDNALDSVERYQCLFQFYLYSIGVSSVKSDISTESLHLDLLRKNSSLLIEAGAFHPLSKNLRTFISIILDQQQIRKEEKKSKTLHDFISVQVDYILDTLWIMLITGASNEVFIEEVASFEPYLAGFLFDAVEKLAEGSFPVSLIFRFFYAVIFLEKGTFMPFFQYL